MRRRNGCITKISLLQCCARRRAAFGGNGEESGERGGGRFVCGGWVEWRGRRLRKGLAALKE